MKKIFIVFMALCCMAVSCVEPVVDMFGSIYGTVTDSNTGEPIRGASVTLSPGNLTKTTGSDGQYEFVDLEAGQYKLQVNANGYETNNRSLSIVAGGKAIGDIALSPVKKEADFELSTTHINFDTEYSELSLEIKNTGNDELEWTITDVEAKWLTVTPTSGKTKAGKSSSVKVKADRSKVTKNEKVYFNVNAAGGSESVMVTINLKPAEPYIVIEPSADIEFGLTEKKIDVTLTAHDDSFAYTATVKSCEGGWLTLSKTSGTIPDYEETQRSETISLVVDRSKMMAEKASCMVEIKAGEQVHKIHVSAETEMAEFALAETTVSLNRGDTYQIVANRDITRCVADNKYSVTVSASGEIRAERIGTTEITVYSGSNKATLVVTVEPEYDMYKIPTFAFDYTINQILSECGSNGEIGDENNYVYYVDYSQYAEAMFMINNGKCDYVAMFVQKNKYAEHKSFLLERYVKLNTGDATSEYYIDTLDEDDADLIVEVYSNYDDYVMVLYSPYYPNYYQPGGGETTDPDNGGGESTPDDGSSTLQNGLYTYYKFDGDFNDSSENAINGFGFNSPEFVTGVDGKSQAVKFSRTANSSFVVSKPIIDSRDMTISFWGKDFSDGGIFHMVSFHNNNDVIFTLSMSNGALKFIVTKYDNWYQYDNCTAFMHPTLTDGKWHHIALVSDFNKTTYATITTLLYVDGQLVDTVTEGANPFSEAETGQQSYGAGVKFIMGGEIALNKTKKLNGTNMSVDNFRVYDTRRLSADEIKAIYNAKQ